jgi:hypothetical protein
MPTPKNHTEACKEYLILLSALKVLENAGAPTKNIKEKMNALWSKMTNEEREWLNPDVKLPDEEWRQYPYEKIN